MPTRGEYHLYIVSLRAIDGVFEYIVETLGRFDATGVASALLLELRHLGIRTYTTLEADAATKGTASRGLFESLGPCDLDGDLSLLDGLALWRNDLILIAKVAVRRRVLVVDTTLLGLLGSGETSGLVKGGLTLARHLYGELDGLQLQVLDDDTRWVAH